MNDLDRVVTNLMAIPRPQRAHFLLQVKEANEELYIQVMDRLRELEDDDCIDEDPTTD